MEDLSFFQKPVSNLDYSDIEWLKNERIPESYNLDYKRDTYGRGKTDELAKDISALANTSGGYLVLGVDEVKDSDEGETYPGEIVGIEKEEDLKKRIIDRIIPSIMPHPEVHFSDLISIPGKQDRVVLVTYIPKSYDSLHMVVVKKRNCYYKRFHDQNVPMDEYEVRIRYEMLGRGQKWTDDRLMEVSEETYIRLAQPEKGALIVATAPLLTSQKFDNFEIARSFNDIKKYKHPWQKYGSTSPLKIHMDYFEKAVTEQNPIARMRLYFDGTACYSTRSIFSEGDSGRGVFVGSIIHEAFHMLRILNDFYILNGFSAYLKLLIQIKKLPGARLSFPDRSQIADIESMPIYDREFPTFSKTIEMDTLLSNRKDLLDECVLPLFREAGFDRTKNCWNGKDEPYEN
jgi:hypothetical protein